MFKNRWVAILFFLSFLLSGCLSNLHQRGLEATGREAYPQAIRFYVEHLKKHPGDLIARNDLGVAYLRSGEYDLAFLEFQKVLASDPRYIRAHYNIALVYNFKGLPEEEIAAYQNALKIDPDHLPSRLNLAHLYIEQGRIGQATAIYEEVLEKHPNQSRALYNLALIYDEAGRRAEAAGLLERFLKQNPDPQWREEAERHLARLKAPLVPLTLSLPPYRYNCASIPMPIKINPTPAAPFNIVGETRPANAVPATTAMAVLKTSAPAAARKTFILLAAALVAKRRVASCVLSPNSAKKTVIKMVQIGLIPLSSSETIKKAIDRPRFTSHAPGRERVDHANWFQARRGISPRPSQIPQIKNR